MLTIHDVAHIIHPVNLLIREKQSLIAHLCFDSRRLSTPSKTLFFAIKTERNDGHLYIDELYQKGVRNFVITEPAENYNRYIEGNFLQVENMILALQQLVVTHREQFTIPVIGITGSNGKTIVKEWLSAMLAEDFHVVKNPNSYNSQIGVPLSVWQMDSTHTLGIFEAGISQTGEMEQLARIIQPKIGILTNLGDAHSHFFHDNYQKLTEKLKLFEQAEVLIYNIDDKEIRDTINQKEYQHLQKISWGEAPDAHFRIEWRRTDETGTFVKIDHQIFAVPFVDDASVENAMHIIILLLHLGFSVDEINRKLSRLTPVNMRMEILEAPNNSIIINDTYSLDTHSLHIALDFLKSQGWGKRKTLIISDFEQVKTLQKEDYDELNRLLQGYDIEKLITVGENLRLYRDCFTIPEIDQYPSTEALLDVIRNMEMQQEAILVKGARKYHFEKVIDLLQLRTHQTILSVNLAAIIHNLNYFKSCIHQDTKVMAMVKAMCYGVGDIELIHELCFHHIDYLAVAYADEGVYLRNRKIKTPIVVLGAEAHSFETMINYELEPEIYNLNCLRLWEKVMEQHPEIPFFNIHLKMDTGMHRLGFDPEDVDELLEIITRNPKLRVASIFSHLAASEDENEDEFTHHQIKKFTEITAKMVDRLDYPVLRHLLNSSGIVRFAEAQFEMVRLGLGLYGYTPVEQVKPHIQPSVTLKTLVTQVKKIGKGESVGYNRTFKAEKEMELAIIPIGYADGYPRLLSNGVGEVIVKSRRESDKGEPVRVPVVGRISMDMTVIDVTGLHITEGDEVTVYGEGISIEEMAEKAGTITYELLTSISRRVQRVYVVE